MVKLGIFKRKKPEPLVLTLNELGERLESAREAQDSESARPFVEKTMETRGEIERILKELDSRDFSQFYKQIITAKPLFIKGMTTAVKSIKIKEPLNYANLVEFYRNITGALSSMHSVQTGPGRLVGAAFREDIVMLGKAVKKIARISDEIGRIVSEKSARNAVLEECVSLCRRLSGKIAELEDARTKKRETESELEKCEAEKSRLERELEKIESSDAMKDAGRAEAELERLKNEKCEIEKMMANKVSPLKRTFRKFQKVVKLEKYKLDRKCANALESFIDEPAKIFLLDCDAFAEILNGSRKSILSGELELDIKEKERALSIIDELLCEVIDETKKRYAEIVKKEKMLCDEIDGFAVLKQKNAIIREIERIKKQAATMEMQLKQIDEQDIINSMTDLKKQAETKASEFEGAIIEISLPEKM